MAKDKKVTKYEKEMQGLRDQIAALTEKLDSLKDDKKFTLLKDRYEADLEAKKQEVQLLQDKIAKLEGKEIDPPRKKDERGESLMDFLFKW